MSHSFFPSPLLSERKPFLSTVVPTPHQSARHVGEGGGGEMGGAWLFGRLILGTLGLMAANARLTRIF